MIDRLASCALLVALACACTTARGRGVYCLDDDDTGLAPDAGSAAADDEEDAGRPSE